MHAKHGIQHGHIHPIQQNALLIKHSPTNPKTLCSQQYVESHVHVEIAQFIAVNIQYPHITENKNVDKHIMINVVMTQHIAILAMQHGTQ